MTASPGPRMVRIAFVPSMLLGLLLPLLVAPSLAAREDAVTGVAPPPESGAAAPSEREKEAAPGERTESLAKPPGDTRPNPEQANPALLNPCHGSPQPKWCGE